jgi:chromosome segregation ATPase
MTDNQLFNKKSNPDEISSFQTLDTLKRMLIKNRGDDNESLSKLEQETYKTLEEYKELGGKYSQSESNVFGLRRLLGEARNNLSQKDKEIEKLKEELKILEEKFREKSESFIAEQEDKKRVIQDHKKQLEVMQLKHEETLNKKNEEHKKKEEELDQKRKEEIEKIKNEYEDRIKVFLVYLFGFLFFLEIERGVY